MSRHDAPTRAPLMRTFGLTVVMSGALAAFSLWQPPPVAAEFAVTEAPQQAAKVLALVGKPVSAARALLGAPEKTSEFQTIYSLPGQEEVQWLYYQRQGLLVGASRQGQVEAILFLPSFEGALPGGVKLGMTRQQVVSLIGQPEHEIVEEGTTRSVYLQRMLDLTFDQSTERLQQVLYYPALKSLGGAEPTANPVTEAPATPRAVPTPQPTPQPTATARPTPHPTATPRPTPTPSPSPRARATVRPVPVAPATQTPAPAPTSLRRTGNATLSGLVSFFRPETGEITYLANALIYVSDQPLDPTAGTRTLRTSGAATRAQWQRYQARMRALSSSGHLITTTMSDQYGRVRIEQLPPGSAYVIVMAQPQGRALAWQQPIALRNGDTSRFYVNRNNMLFLGEP